MPDTNRYACASTGQVINITDVDPSARYALGPYTCLACDHVMVPALGRTRRHHFKHKAGRPASCLNETYLHQLAKMTLFAALSDAIRLGRPYNLVQNRKSVCDRYADQFGLICTRQSMPAPRDLAARYDRVALEAGIDGYAADILLSSSRTAEAMLLEIAVTHPCDEEKISSGLEIIEITVRGEDEIEALAQGLDAVSGRVQHHNPAQLDPVEKCCTEPCSATGLALLLYRNGKPWYAEPDLAAHEEITADPQLETSTMVDPRISYEQRRWSEIRDPLKAFMIAQAFEHGRHVRSCMLCWNNGGRVNDHDIYCDAKDRKVWMSSSAVGCPSYWPAETADEAERLFDSKVR
ncbi:hypothetical protein [Roseivivax sp. THAF30]|uniref:hypothetical protein n=1 Tax=Roseivivax sp. THAF30 TaxID=2587852 RepID=UPI0012694266|nr:hypothetical protein [Roseivivax sp. THAF30]QFT61825.1 hypothetical protein FIU91_02695 [Roseivivax sp. THAF30]